ncbi:MAG: hypothetical protein JNM02_14840 [Anaerolineales bacterium]|nr:hypothetical protein [Anaerolineales bacterium]
MKKNYSILIILTFSLLVGFFTFNQYGESWDDKSLQKYAVKSVNAYTTWPQQGVVNLVREDLGYYGPFYIMFVDRATEYLRTFLSFSLPDLRHLIYFLTYLAGVWAFYALAKRWLTEIPALGATLLFMTQPVLWGHAFINPKDTPFLSLFLLSIYFGLKQFDTLEQTHPAELDPRSKRISALLTALWLVSVFSLFLFTQTIHSYIESLVLSAQAGGTNIFSLLAKDINAVSAEVYTQRYFILFLQLRTYYFLLSTLILLIIWYKFAPQLPATLFAVLLPAILLGFTTSTRILGPFAGVIVAYYAFRTKGRQATSAIVMYAVVALITTYLTWPYLWMNPIPRFFESLREMSLYPWLGAVLFHGISYQSTDLPYSYLPVLFAIQLTEPVWVLSIVGWVGSIVGAEKKRGLVELSLLWFVIPLILFIVLHIALYDNFRQILFIIPPIFLMAGVVFEKIKDIKWQVAVMVLSLVPGIFGIVSLHPYEYMYYNSFIGGVNGAYGRYDLDYWGISYREAAEYVNSVAPPNAAVWVEGPSHLFALFAREDLKIYSPSEVERSESYAYVVATARYDFDKTSYPDAEIVYKIMRGDAVLAVIKKP